MQPQWCHQLNLWKPAKLPVLIWVQSFECHQQDTDFAVFSIKNLLAASERPNTESLSSIDIQASKAGYKFPSTSLLVEITPVGITFNSFIAYLTTLG
jgi:hypothetical protein